jgi:hypothetical protein
VLDAVEQLGEKRPADQYSKFVSLHNV